MHDLKKALTTAKTFTASRRKNIKDTAIPSIRGAYVTPEYVYATDSKIMIRIKHDNPDNITEPYNYMYSPTDEKYLLANPKKYPPVDRLIPAYENATLAFHITDAKEWKNIHEMVTILKSNKFGLTIDFSNMMITSESINKSCYGPTSFSYRDLPLERIPFVRQPFKNKELPKMHYAANLMVQGMKAFTKLKVYDNLTLSLYEQNKPLIISGPGIDVAFIPLSKLWMGVEPIKQKESRKKSS